MYSFAAFFMVVLKPGAPGYREGPPADDGFLGALRGLHRPCDRILLPQVAATGAVLESSATDALYARGSEKRV